MPNTIIPSRDERMKKREERAVDERREESGISRRPSAALTRTSNSLWRAFTIHSSRRACPTYELNHSILNQYIKLRINLRERFVLKQPLQKFRITSCACAVRRVSPEPVFL